MLSPIASLLFSFSSRAISGPTALKKTSLLTSTPYATALFRKMLKRMFISLLSTARKRCLSSRALFWGVLTNSLIFFCVAIASATTQFLFWSFRYVFFWNYNVAGDIHKAVYCMSVTASFRYTAHKDFYQYLKRKLPEFYKRFSSSFWSITSNSSMKHSFLFDY